MTLVVLGNESLDELEAMVLPKFAEVANRDTDIEAQSGSSLLENIVSLMTTLKGDIERSASTISSLEEDCKEIDTVLEVIRGITEQTNLLA